MMNKIQDIEFELQRKRIKRMHIHIKAPSGDVLVTAPMRLPESEIMAFVKEKESWIRKNVERMRKKSRQERNELKYVTGDKLYVWGRPLELEVVEDPGVKRGKVIAEGERLILLIHPGSSFSEREKIIKSWYKDLITEKAGSFLEYWKEKTGLSFDSWHVREMKTRWGSCIVPKKRICINTRLAEKDISCLDYVALHEIAHLKEPNHGPKFKAILDKYMPLWREAERKLKS